MNQARVIPLRSQGHELRARSHGGPISAPRMLLVASPGVARTGYLLRQAAFEIERRGSVLVVDFGGTEAELLAGLPTGAGSVLVEADTREGIFPLAGLRSLSESAREAAGTILTDWLLPRGHLQDARDLRSSFGLFARLPVLLPRTGLYAWRRYQLYRGYRRECIRGLRSQGIDPAPLRDLRPGTALWDVLSERVQHVLGHDDTLDRVFPLGEPEALADPAAAPELRALRLQTPWAERDARYPTLLWLHLLTVLANRPRQRADGRSYLSRLILVDPPEAAWRTSQLLADVVRSDLRTTIVTPDRRATTSPDSWFGVAPAVLLQRSFGPERLAAWGELEQHDAQRLLARERGAKLLYVHQRGAPVERWCSLDSPGRLPGASPEALIRAHREGRRRFLVERQRVVANRLRVESHAARSARRSASHGLLERALRMERLTSAWRRTYRNRGAPGSDRLTVETFAASWQQRLAALQGDVRERRYRPRPYLRVWGLKASGESRPMALPSVTDRVLMGAAADVLSPLLEPHPHAARPLDGAARPGLRGRGP